MKRVALLLTAIAGACDDVPEFVFCVVQCKSALDIDDPRARARTIDPLSHTPPHPYSQHKTM